MPYSSLQNYPFHQLSPINFSVVLQPRLNGTILLWNLKRCRFVSFFLVNCQGGLVFFCCWGVGRFYWSLSATKTGGIGLLILQDSFHANLISNFSIFLDNLFCCISQFRNQLFPLRQNILFRLLLLILEALTPMYGC